MDFLMQDIGHSIGEGLKILIALHSTMEILIDLHSTMNSPLPKFISKIGEENTKSKERIPL